MKRVQSEGLLNVVLTSKAKDEYFVANVEMVYVWIWNIQRTESDVSASLNYF